MANNSFDTHAERPTNTVRKTVARISAGSSDGVQRIGAGTLKGVQRIVSSGCDAGQAPFVDMSTLCESERVSKGLGAVIAAGAALAINQTVEHFTGVNLGLEVIKGLGALTFGGNGN